MEAPLNSLLTHWDFTMWPLAASTGWPHKGGFLIRKCTSVSPGQQSGRNNKVAVLTR